MNTDKDKVIEILSKNKYMALATVNPEQKPWNVVVFYAYDKNYNLYFVSASDSGHAINISVNRNISAVIYDSSQAIGDTEELKIGGIASIVRDNELDKALILYSSRIKERSGNNKNLQEYERENYIGPSEFKVFKVEAKEFYINRNGRSIEVRMDQKD